MPDINVRGNGQDIADGDLAPRLDDHTDFGNADVVGTAVTRTFTIQNLAAGDLLLTATPRVQIIGPAAGDFSVLSFPDTPIASGGSATFDIRFDPSAPGVRWATVVIASNDPDEGSYEFAIQGTGEADFGDADYSRWAASYQIVSVFDSADVPGQSHRHRPALEQSWRDRGAPRPRQFDDAVGRNCEDNMRILLQNPNRPRLFRLGLERCRRGRAADGRLTAAASSGSCSSTEPQPPRSSRARPPASRWGYPSLNQSGEVAYEAGTYMVGNETIKYYTGGTLTTVVDLTGLITSLRCQQNVSLNNRGQVVFAGYGRPAVGQPSTAGGFVYDRATRDHHAVLLTAVL